MKTVTRNGREYRYVLIGEGDERILYMEYPDGSCDCVGYGYEQEFANGGDFRVATWDGFTEIKKPKYRPYKSVGEFKDRLADGWVIQKGSVCPDRIVSIAISSVFLAVVEDGIISVTFEDLLKDFTWYSDGGPCGVKEE